MSSRNASCGLSAAWAAAGRLGRALQSLGVAELTTAGSFEHHGRPALPQREFLGDEPAAAASAGAALATRDATLANVCLS